ncbi:hypothetical protein R2F61_05610 [Mollicutes bacterium LVI A0078]|nr:hypothetical protein RZE84_05625 [Mollicutes bacterium LVI A0075]WOO90206.1 hypothetical protein R2F61_05610 [Mollicutes bacterium LVI A0078]
MSNENALEIIIKEVLTTPIGAKLISYNKLANQHQCSRRVFQLVIANLESTAIISLDKSQGGNILIAINYNKLLLTYFPSLLISCPNIILSNEHDELSLTLLDRMSTFNITPHFSYNNSSNKRILMLDIDSVNMAIITNSYYATLNTNEYKILEKYNIVNPIYTTLKVNENNDTLEYIIDEVSTLHLADVSFQEYSVPNEYYLICKPHIYNLLRNQK